MQVLHALIVMIDLFRQSHHATIFSKTTETFPRANEAAWEHDQNHHRHICSPILVCLIHVGNYYWTGLCALTDWGLIFLAAAHRKPSTLHYQPLF